MTFGDLFLQFLCFTRVQSYLKLIGQFYIVNHSRRLLVRDSETSARRESSFCKSRILPVGVMVRSGCLGDFYHVTDFDHLTNYIHSREYFFTFCRGDKKRDKNNVITFTT